MLIPKVILVKPISSNCADYSDEGFANDLEKVPNQDECRSFVSVLFRKIEESLRRWAKVLDTEVRQCEEALVNAIKALVVAPKARRKEKANALLKHVWLLRVNEPVDPPKEDLEDIDRKQYDRPCNRAEVVVQAMTEDPPILDLASPIIVDCDCGCQKVVEVV